LNLWLMKTIGTSRKKWKTLDPKHNYISYYSYIFTSSFCKYNTKKIQVIWASYKQSVWKFKQE
jgi:hypothetical protein